MTRIYIFITFITEGKKSMEVKFDRKKNVYSKFNSDVFPAHNLSIRTIIGYFALEPTADKEYATTYDDKTNNCLEK